MIHLGRISAEGALQGRVNDIIKKLVCLKLIQATAIRGPLLMNRRPRVGLSRSKAPSLARMTTIRCSEAMRAQPPHSQEWVQMEWEQQQEAQKLGQKHKHSAQKTQAVSGSTLLPQVGQREKEA